ncbi:unnamed protein product [Ascophyllum nodosum]
MVFDREDVLDIHMGTHRRAGDGGFVRLYSCNAPGCGKSFTEKRNLNVHRRATHTEGGRKKFRCEVSGCGMTFAHRHTLVKHVKREHKTHRSAAAPPGVEASGECDGVGRKDSRTPDESHTTTPASDERGTPPE